MPQALQAKAEITSRGRLRDYVGKRAPPRLCGRSSDLMATTRESRKPLADGFGERPTRAVLIRSSSEDLGRKAARWRRRCSNILKFDCATAQECKLFNGLWGNGERADARVGEGVAADYCQGACERPVNRAPVPETLRVRYCLRLLGDQLSCITHIYCARGLYSDSS